MAMWLYSMVWANGSFHPSQSVSLAELYQLGDCMLLPCNQYLPWYMRGMLMLQTMDIQSMHMNHDRYTWSKLGSCNTQKTVYRHGDMPISVDADYLTLVTLVTLQYIIATFIAGFGVVGKPGKMDKMTKHINYNRWLLLQDDQVQ